MSVMAFDNMRVDDGTGFGNAGMARSRAAIRPVGDGTTGGGTNPPTTQKMAYSVFRDILAGLAGFSPEDDNIFQELYNLADEYFSEGISPALIPDLLANRKDIATVAPNFTKFLGDFQKIRQQDIGITTVADLNTARSTYKTVMRRYGLDEYVSNATADQFLANGVSATEAAARLETAFNAVNNADEALKEQLRVYYPSLQPKDIAATMLGIGKTVDQLQKEISIAGIRAEQQLAGFQSTLSAEDVAAQGVSRGQARQGFQQTALEAQTYTAAAQRAGISAVDLQKELESENVLGLASQRRKKIQQAEQNLFSGTSGTANVSLSRSPAGNF